MIKKWRNLSFDDKLYYFVVISAAIWGSINLILLIQWFIVN
jgi:hypothetical protein